MNTAENTRAALAATLAIAEAIRGLGEVPSGEMYARICDKVSLEFYQGCIRTLKKAGLVREEYHLLKWIGPVFPK